MKIYVASSWRNKYQPDTVEILRKFNHEVYDFRNPPNGSGGFAWSDIDENWQAWTTEEYCKALQHPVAEEGFNSDFDGMKWADVCVMVLPCGRSANTEAGWMKGAGKKVYVFQPEKQEPELMYKIYDGVFSDINLLVAELATLSPSTEVENGWVKAGKMVIDILVENHQAQIAGFYNYDKTDEEKKKRNAVIEEYSDLIGIFKAKFKNESK